MLLICLKKKKKKKKKKIYIYIYICAIKFTSQPLSNLIYSKKYNFP